MVSESVDRKLPLHRRMIINLHLFMCRYCNRLKKQMLLLRTALRCEETPDAGDGPAPSLSNETRQRIKQAMRDIFPDPDPDSLNT